MSDVLRLGTRRSPLAMAQSRQVADALETVSGRVVDLVPITSEGDVSRASLSEIGGRGVFATRLRDALRAGECDLLVHSLKDLPTQPSPGLVIAGIPARADARDVVITRDGRPLHTLPVGARIGTGSPRRRAQLGSRNPRVEVVDIRGNVDSRVQRVRDGELDAVILAAAGLGRLGVPERLAGEFLGLSEWPTAPGQGALAIEIREDAPADLRDAVAALDDPVTRAAVTAERAVLAGLDAGCQAPMGSHADIVGGRLRVRTIVYGTERGSRVSDDHTATTGEYGGTTGSGNGADTADAADLERVAERAGTDSARRLLAHGAADLVRESTP